MIRSMAAIGVLGLAALFGYFFVTNSGEKSNKERAKDALAKVGDTVVDKGLGAAVSTRIVSAFGLEATRFVHVHNDDGVVTVYGLASDAVTAEQVEAQAKQIPGVKTVKVVLQPLPAHLGGAASAANPESGGGG